MLNKVIGEENPAELPAKHSLSKERLLKLTALFGCHFRDGRVVSAPLTSTTASSKITLAQADRSLASLSCIEAGYGYRMPVQDLTKLEDDTLYAAGMQVVQKILEISVSGRTSGRPPTTTSA